MSLLHTPVGSEYVPGTNTIVLSPKYATPELVAVADKLILYRLERPRQVGGLQGDLK
ncbi:hypothetical protein ABZS52_28640 [Micromonospora profundi]|uniref:hypothetical protein n=1 Tax=Micromonospora profundi TaxID=1420889 RepID=UPI0033BC43C4